MIRVLHFVSTPAIWSGVMGVIMNYYRHLDRSEIQFDFLCFLPCEESYEEEIRTLGGRVFFLPKPGASPQGIRALKAMRDFFHTHVREYAWVHNHEVYLSVLLNHFIIRYGNGSTRLIVHCHTTRYTDRRAAAIRNWLLCLPLAYMDCTRFACSATAGRFLYHDLLSRKQRFTVIPNAIETQQFIFNPSVRLAYRKLLGIHDEFIIGTVGRMVPQKNHVGLIRIFEKIRRQVPEVKLLLVGNGPLADTLWRHVQSLYLESSVLCPGERTDIPGFLQAMDLFVLPSVFEGFPVSCVEAQASGLPCFLSDAITSEVRFSSQVCFLPLGSEAKWAEECIRLINTMREQPKQPDRKCPESLPDIASEAEKLACFYMS